MKAVCVCDTQPVTAVGIRTLLGDHEALSFTESVDSLSDSMDFVHGNRTSVLLVDKSSLLSGESRDSRLERQVILH